MSSSEQPSAGTSRLDLTLGVDSDSDGLPDACYDVKKEHGAK